MESSNFMFSGLFYLSIVLIVIIFIIIFISLICVWFRCENKPYVKKNKNYKKNNRSGIIDEEKSEE